jgi:hypothetical protein
MGGLVNYNHFGLIGKKKTNTNQKVERIISINNI